MKVQIKYMSIYIFLVMWQFFFFDNGILRLYPYVFWPLMSIIAVVMGSFSLRQKINKPQGYTLLALLICILSSFLSPNRGVAFAFLAEVTMYYICVQYICRQEDNIYTAINIAHSFAVFHLVFLMLQRFIPSLFYMVAPYIKGNVSVITIENVAIGSDQLTAYTGLTGQTSTISLYLILGLLISLYKLGLTYKKKEYVLTVAFLIGIFLTNRRLNSLCGIALVIVYLALENRSFLRKLTIFLLATATVLVVGYRSIPGVAGIIDKFTITGTYGNLLSGRERAWDTALTLFLQNPWNGIGFCGYTKYSEFINAHNSYLQKLCELGVVGALVFFLPYLRSLRCCMGNMIANLRRKRSMDLNSYAASLLTFLFLNYVAVISFAEGMFETQIFFIVLFLFQNFAESQYEKRTGINREGETK